MSTLAQWLQSRPLTEIQTRLGGLFPRTWVCVGTGFSREEVKAELLGRLGGMSSRVVLTPQELALRFAPAGVERSRELAGLPARREVIERLWGQPALLAQLEKLKRLRRRPDAVGRLEHALSQGRLGFLGVEDAQSFEADLERGSSGGRRGLRRELLQFSVAYEAVLEQCGWVDYPMALRLAVEALENSPESSNVEFPDEILLCDVRERGEPREEVFWSLLGQHVQITRLRGVEGRASGVVPPPENRSTIWHTWDDVASSAVERWMEDRKLCVVIPPAPWDRIARRSLMRALHVRGLFLEDERDPLFARREEQVRRALLPLKIVARGLRRADLVEWLQGFEARPSGSAQKLAERGWVQARGREDVETVLGMLEPTERAVLARWLKAAQGKHPLRVWRDLSLEFLEGLGTSRPDSAAVGFLRRVWEEWSKDAERLGDGDRAVRIAWVERGLRLRVEQMAGPAPALRDAEGLLLYRLGQVPPGRLTEQCSGILFLGIQPDVFSAKNSDRSTDDLWWSGRERERLSATAGLRSRRDILQERTALHAQWRTQFAADRCWDLQAAWDRSGVELPCWPGQVLGAHRDTVSAYQPLRLLPARSVDLDAREVAHYSASMVEEWSRCAFRALVRQRWKLKDWRDADPEGWVEDIGSLLHEAVRLGMEAKRAGFPISSQEQLDAAWRVKAPRGLERSEMRRAQVVRKCVRILDQFWEEEALWGAQPWAQSVRDLANDDLELRLELPSGVVVGKPDRIVDTPWGIWVQDYKTSQLAQLPVGQKMLSLGYRLQLPFYALAARARFEREVAGVQFVSLSLKGGRERGVFFKKWNGKDSESLTQLHVRNGSLTPGEPEAVWGEFAQKIDDVIRGWKSAHFVAEPRVATECERCSARAICGQSRAEVLGGEGGAE